MNNNKIAILIDGENISSKEIKNVFNEASNYGNIIIGNLYINDTAKKSWKDSANKFALTAKLHYNVAQKKNGSDIALAVDAMDIMHKGNVDTIFIISSDSDFTTLAKELKANGLTVNGIGSEDSPEALKNVYSKFISFEVLNGQDNTQTEKNEEDSANDDLNTIQNIIREIIISNQTGNQLILSELGNLLNNKMPSFDTRKYGVTSLSNLIRLLDTIDLEKEDKVYYAKLNESHAYSLADVKSFIESTLDGKGNKSMKLPRLLEMIKGQFPEFDFAEYGYTKFSAFIRSIENIQTNKQDAIIEQQ